MILLHQSVVVRASIFPADWRHVFPGPVLGGSPEKYGVMKPLMEKLVDAAFSFRAVHIPHPAKFFLRLSASTRACLVQIVLQLHARP